MMLFLAALTPWVKPAAILRGLLPLSPKIDPARLVARAGEVSGQLSAGVAFLLFTGGYRKAPVEALPHRAAFDHWAEFPGLLAEVARG